MVQSDSCMAIIYHEELVQHDHWPNHPESPFRLKSIKKKLEQEGLWTDIIVPQRLDEKDLLEVHSLEHIERIRKGGNMPMDPDTMLKDQTYDLANLAAGAAYEAAKKALDGKMSIALTRPPGHHARANQAGGFCYFNNVAVAAQKSHVRTAIVDIDAHHGNGTEEIFYCRDDVLFISLHQMDCFPGTGHFQDIGDKEGRGYNVNIPLEKGSGNKVYSQAFEQIVEPILRIFSPKLTMVSLGVDAHYCDTLSNMNLNTPGYVSLSKRLMELMDYSNLAFVLEGGYHLRATAEVVAGVVSAFEGKNIKPEYTEEREEPVTADSMLALAKREHSKHWDI